MWGCMMWEGVGKCCRITGHMTAAMYIKILEEGLLESLQKFGKSVSDIVFQHDNDTKHAAKITKYWLHDRGFEVMQWPPQSPDLNPIEHLWGEVKRAIASDGSDATNLNSLWQKTESTWNAIDPAKCSKLVSSMPHRIAAVLKARGGYTKY